MNDRNTEQSDGTGERDSSANTLPRRLSSGALFGDASEVIIEHQGESYRLRRTSRGKLILTK